MDWSDTPEQAEFRSEVRAFIERSLPAYYRRLAAEGRDPGWRGGWRTDRISDDDEVRSAAIDWAEALRERSWVAPHWPTEYGGAGMSSVDQFILNSELAAAGTPTLQVKAFTLFAPDGDIEVTITTAKIQQPPGP